MVGWLMSQILSCSWIEKKHKTEWAGTKCTGSLPFKAPHEKEILFVVFRLASESLVLPVFGLVEEVISYLRSREWLPQPLLAGEWGAQSVT